MTDAPFPIDWPEAPAMTLHEGATELSAGQRLTQTILAKIRAGEHPLRTLIHPLAKAEECHPERPGKQHPYTCGSCRFRELTPTGTSRAWPKCVVNGLTDGRVTRGPATDVRAWWPACYLYEAGDAQLGPDAARSIPVERCTDGEQGRCDTDPCSTTCPRTS